MSKLTGDPPDDQNDNQVNLPRIALDDIKKMARRAFVQIQPAGSFEKAYNLISQDSSEPFTTFVDRVIQAAERQCGDDIARPIMIRDIIENNASPECKRAIKALGKERPTVPEMIDACNQIGSSQHIAMIQANELGKTIGEKIERALTAQAAQAETRDQKLTEILAALHLSSQQQDNTMAVMQATVTSGPCYFCKRPGHIVRNCPDIKRGVQAPDCCSTCVPQEIKTDNGPSYTSQELAAFLNDWGVRHTFGIPYSPTSQGMIERTHQTLKRILDQQKGGEDQAAPQKRLNKALYVYNFLNSSAEEPDPPIYRHFLNNKKAKLKEHPPVLIKNLDSGQIEGPYNLITWGKGFACVSTEKGLQWIPAKNVKPYHASKPAETPTSASTAANQEASTQT
ncbi:hypothetical protein DUI87_02961 [Hirundo rustica rustica]|uniref:Uncharacterized protein n=1 Tax=Hirundo rustica rustica TaxID=333673 RepID=A0A3M0L9B8_HIRRU|nr:hypothetical protein DUI87_02961 [Hirundo rustica rustica]